LRKTND